MLGGLFRRLEDAIPPSTRLAGWLREQGYGVVLVSPLVDHGSDQADVVKAAQLAGIPTGALITSWDNLTTKGVMRVRPDRVFVWNETQRQEAAEMHGVPRRARRRHRRAPLRPLVRAHAEPLP